MEFRKVARTQEQITAEWDELAPIRFQQITSRQDFTFWEILTPSILSMLALVKDDRIIDAGCGVGVLSNILLKEHRDVVGVDPSTVSIQIARDNFSLGPKFVASTLESYANSLAPTVSTVVANMVLMDVLDLRAFLDAAFSLLRPNGHLIFTITHPFFWPEYYGYSSQPWFHYEQEAIVESPFRISSQPDCRLVSTHVHRPLNTYLTTLFGCGFTTELLEEPMPSAHVAKMYPQPWRVPRYLVGLARREAKRGLSRPRRVIAKNATLPE